MGDVCEEITVGFVGPMTSEYREAGVPFLRSMNIEPFRINKTDLKFVSPAFHARISKSRLRAGDVVIVRTGAPGTAAVVPDWMHDGNCSDLVIARPGPGVDARFLCYYVNAVTHHIVNEHVVGAVQQHFNVGAAKSLKLPLPPLPEQRAIARVLGGLDDKIELNRRMNRTLEDLARGVFRSWFVDFDPVVKPSKGFAGPSRGFAGPSKGLAGSGSPRPSSGGGSVPLASPSAGAAPADLFPKRLVDSPLGPIPEGWRVGTVGEIGTNPRRGVLPSEVDATTPYIGLEHMPRRCIALDDWGTAADVSSGKSRFARGEILFGKLRPYFHKVGVALIDGVCSTDVIVAAPKKECWFGVLLGHLSSDEFIDYVDGASGGTRMPRTGWGDMARYQIVIPPEPIVASYSAWMRQVAEMLRIHAHESRSLAALRDALLPQLLSGEIRLREADRAVDDALRSNSPLPRAGGNKRPRAGMAAGTSKGRA